MKSVAFWVILILSRVLTWNLFAQDTIPYPSMKEVKPAVVASIQQVADEYLYDYTVSNGLGASQHIWTFMIQVLSATVRGVAPADWDASRARRTNLVAMTLASVDSTKDISDGSSLSGFRIVSPGLPAIIRFYAVGFIPIPYGEFISQEGTDDIFVNSAQGHTIGPSDPPTPFVALNFLDTIISMKNKAKSLDWIKWGDISDETDFRLDKARSHLAADDVPDAITELQTLRNTVFADCTQVPPISYLTTEACALLQINIDYLIANLK